MVRVTLSYYLDSMARRNSLLYIPINMWVVTVYKICENRQRFEIDGAEMLWSV